MENKSLPMMGDINKLVQDAVSSISQTKTMVAIPIDPEKLADPRVWEDCDPKMLSDLIQVPVDNFVDHLRQANLGLIQSKIMYKNPFEHIELVSKIALASFKMVNKTLMEKRRGNLKD